MSRTDGAVRAAPAAANAPAAAAARGPLADDEPGAARAYDGRLLLRLWPFVRPHRGALLLSLLLLPATSLLTLLQPYLVKLVIDEAIVPRALGRLAPLAGLLLGVLLLDRLLQYAQTMLLERCGQRSMHDLRCAAHRHLLRRSSAFFDRALAGKLLTRLTNDVESIAEAFSSGLVVAVGDVLTLVGIVGAMFWLSPRLALLTLGALPLLLGVLLLFRRLVRTAQEAIRRTVALINGTLQEQITGMKVVQIFGREERARALFDDANRQHRDAFSAAIRYDASLFAIVELLGSVAVATLLWYGGARALEGAATFGLLVAFIEYVQRFFVPVRDLSAKYTTMQQAMVATGRVFELLDDTADDGRVVDCPPTAVGGGPGSSGPGAATSPMLPGDEPAALVVLDDVSFGYAAAQPVLHQISLVVARGETVALVGPTGSGKTTLVRLLTRLYEPEAGAIIVAGRDVRAWDLGELRRRVVTVSQDVVLFAGTVASNIALGDRHVTAQAVEAAAQVVGLTRRLPLAAEVAERGGNLSAGERQLVAFARALARDPLLLVLDEATAAVDPESERLVQDGIAELLRGRTAIVVAHRLSTIERAARIIVLQRGRIVEQGTHAALVTANGLYARLHALQQSPASGSPVPRATTHVAPRLT